LSDGLQPTRPYQLLLGEADRHGQNVYHVVRFSEVLNFLMQKFTFVFIYERH